MNRMTPAEVIHKRHSMKLSPTVPEIPDATWPCSRINVQVTSFASDHRRFWGLRPSEANSEVFPLAR